jgi:hypothetical protein
MIFARHQRRPRKTSKELNDVEIEPNGNEVFNPLTYADEGSISVLLIDTVTASVV